MRAAFGDPLIQKNLNYYYQNRNSSQMIQLWNILPRTLGFLPTSLLLQATSWGTQDKHCWFKAIQIPLPQQGILPATTWFLRPVSSSSDMTLIYRALFQPTSSTFKWDDMPVLFLRNLKLYFKQENESEHINNWWKWQSFPIKRLSP